MARKKTTLKDLRNQYRKNYIEMNSRYASAQKNGDNFSIFDETYEKLNRLYGMGVDKRTGLPNMGNVSKMNRQQLLSGITIQKQFLRNPFTKEDTRQAILDNAFQGFKDTNNFATGIGKTKFLQTIDILNNKVFHNLFHLKNISSDTVLQLMRNSNKKTVMNVLMDVVNNPKFGDMDREEIEKKLLEGVKDAIV